MAESGYTLTLDAGDDLRALNADLRSTIGPVVEALFVAPIAELNRIAGDAKCNSLRALCAAIAGLPVAIEVNVADPADPWSADTFARFGPVDAEWRVGLRDPLPATLPASCPAGLIDFYSAFGGLNVRYGWSGEIVVPQGIRSARSILTAHGIDNSELIREAERRDAYGFWEVDGDWLCWLVGDEVAWLGIEWHEGLQLESAGTIEEALTRLYRSATKGERFHG